jgi:hypothetical protein
VQIGGGVRVGDAFQAIVASKLIAIWGRWFCVEISQVGHRASLALNKRDTYSNSNRAKAKHKWACYTNGLNDGGGEATEQFFMFDRDRLNLKHT